MLKRLINLGGTGGHHMRLLKNLKKYKKGIRPTAVEIYLNKAVKNGVIIKPNSRVLKIKLSKNKIAMV